MFKRPRAKLKHKKYIKMLMCLYETVDAPLCAVVQHRRIRCTESDESSCCGQRAQTRGLRGRKSFLN